MIRATVMIAYVENSVENVESAPNCSAVLIYATIRIIVKLFRIAKIRFVAFGENEG